MDKKIQRGEQRGLSVQSAEPEIKEPSLFNVVLFNDNFTPMDFVVEVLQIFFGVGKEKAVQVMLEVHYQGKGICGKFSKDIAETKVQQVSQYARQHDYPLLCKMEPA